MRTLRPFVSPASLRAVPPHRWRAAFLAAVVLVVAVVGVKHVVKAATPSRLGTQTRTAVLRWREPVNDLAAGVNVYDGSKYVYPYPNPPVMALVLWPLEQLPPLAGVAVWFALKAAMAAAALAWAFRLCGPVPGGAKAVAVVLSLHPILGDLSHGNVNIFVAFLVLGSLELLRRRLDFAAGLVLALAVACKVTPGLFLPYLVWKRAWRAVAGSVVGLSLWLVVVPGAAVGWQHNLALLSSWYGGMVRPFVADGQVTSERANQSLPGLAFRLLTAGPSNPDRDADDAPYVPEFHTIADLGPGGAGWVVRGFQAAFVLAVVALCRTRERQGLAFAAECGLIVLGTLLFSERTWKHHGVTLVLPFAVLATCLASREILAGWRRWVVGTVGVIGALTLGPGLLGDAGQDLALIYGSYTAAFLLLATVMGANLVALRRIRPSP